MKVHSIVFAAAITLSAALPAGAQSPRHASLAPAVNVAAVLQAYPQGGDELAAAVCEQIKADPAVAGAVVRSAEKAARRQKVAIARGLLCALRALDGVDADGARAVRAAMAAADPALAAIIEALQAVTAAQTGEGEGRGKSPFFFGGGGFASGGGGGGRVSPN